MQTQGVEEGGSGKLDKAQTQGELSADFLL